MIISNRLYIREPNMDDVKRFSEYRNKLEVFKYQTWRKYSYFKALRRIKYCIKHPFSKKYGSYQWMVCLKDNDYIIGDIFLAVESTNQVSLGYTFDSLFWGQGYAYEALQQVIDYLREQDFKIINCDVYSENSRSIKLLERLGFKQKENVFYENQKAYLKRL